MPMQLVVESNDDDGAGGDVQHEWIELDGCVIFDGAIIGNADGLLRDEVIILNQSTLCLASRLCGQTAWKAPLLEVFAEDCGTNRSSDPLVIPGILQAPPELCEPTN